MEWLWAHWQAILGTGSFLAFLRYLPRSIRWLVVLADCPWHRTQGLAREAALELEVKRLREAAAATMTSRAVAGPTAGSAGSGSTAPPTIPSGTPPSATSVS